MSDVAIVVREEWVVPLNQQKRIANLLEHLIEEAKSRSGFLWGEVWTDVEDPSYYCAVSKWQDFNHWLELHVSAGVRNTLGEIENLFAGARSIRFFVANLSLEDAQLLQTNYMETAR